MVRYLLDKIDKTKIIFNWKKKLLPETRKTEFVSTTGYAKSTIAYLLFNFSNYKYNET